VERSAETTTDDPDGKYLKRNRWFESGSLQRRVINEPFQRRRACGSKERARALDTAARARRGWWAVARELIRRGISL
jgi:hypothetical protein